MPSVARILSWRAISLGGYNFQAGSSNESSGFAATDELPNQDAEHAQ
jgi:hypothetical protein